MSEQQGAREIAFSAGARYEDTDARMRHALSIAPPFPSATNVPPALVPPPPRLDAAATLQELALTLARAYRGAVQSRFDGPCFLFARGDITKSKYYVMLIVAARTFLEHEIAPAAWCAWSMDIWRERSNATRPPPVQWVFGENRIVERRGWFRAEAGAYEGGQALYGLTHKRLLARWQRMLGALLRGNESAEAVVEQYFPDGSYEHSVKLAHAEREATMARLDRMVEKGGWLW